MDKLAAVLYFAVSSSLENITNLVTFNKMQSTLNLNSRNNNILVRNKGQQGHCKMHLI